MENRETQTSNTEEMVTISRAEYERFQEQAQVITSLTLQNEWLLEQLKLPSKKSAHYQQYTPSAEIRLAIICQKSCSSAL